MSFALTDNQTEIELWCASYVTAFSAYDAAGIGHHWAFPAVITQFGRRISFSRQEDFDANTSALLSFYDAQGVKRADRSLIDVLPLNADTAAITVADTMRSEDESAIVEWRAAYVLQRVNQDWKAIMAVADGELAAWRQRGTPLGRA